MRQRKKAVNPFAHRYQYGAGPTGRGVVGGGGAGRGQPWAGARSRMPYLGDVSGLAGTRGPPRPHNARVARLAAMAWKLQLALAAFEALTWVPGLAPLITRKDSHREGPWTLVWTNALPHALLGSLVSSRVLPWDAALSVSAVYVPYLALYCAMQAYFWWIPYLFGPAGVSATRLASFRPRVAEAVTVLPALHGEATSLVPALEHTLQALLSVATLAATCAWHVHIFAGTKAKCTHGGAVFGIGVMLSVLPYRLFLAATRAGDAEGAGVDGGMGMGAGEFDAEAFATAEQEATGEGEGLGGPNAADAVAALVVALLCVVICGVVGGAVALTPGRGELPPRDLLRREMEEAQERDRRRQRRTQRPARAASDLGGEGSSSDEERARFGIERGIERGVEGAYDHTGRTAERQAHLRGDAGGHGVAGGGGRGGARTAPHRGGGADEDSEGADDDELYDLAAYSAARR